MGQSDDGFGGIGAPNCQSCLEPMEPSTDAESWQCLPCEAVLLVDEV